MNYAFEKLSVLLAGMLVASAAMAVVPNWDDDRYSGAPYGADFVKRYENNLQTWSTCTHDEPLGQVSSPNALDNLSVTEIKCMTVSDIYCHTNILQSGEELSSIAGSLNSFSRMNEDNKAKAVLTIVMDMSQGPTVYRFATRAGTDWVFLDGVNPTDLEGLWDFKIEVDSSIVPYKARYYVRPYGQDDYTMLTLNGEGWVTSPYSGEANVGERNATGVQLTGAGIMRHDILGHDGVGKELLATRPAYLELDDHYYEISYSYSSMVANVDLTADTEDAKTRYGADLKVRFDIMKDDEVVNMVEVPISEAQSDKMVLDLTPEIAKGNEYTIKMTFNGSDTVPAISNCIDGIVLSGAGTFTVADDGQINISGSHNLQLDSSKIEIGPHKVNRRDGNKVYKFEWTDDKSGLGKLAKYNDASGILEVKEGMVANGYPSFLSYLLGLDAEVATSRPRYETVLTAEGASAKIKFSGIAPRTDTATFSYRLVDSLDVGGEYSKVMDLDDPSVITFPLTWDGRVRFYKVEIEGLLK